MKYESLKKNTLKDKIDRFLGVSYIRKSNSEFFHFFTYRVVKKKRPFQRIITYFTKEITHKKIGIQSRNCDFFPLTIDDAMMMRFHNVEVGKSTIKLRKEHQFIKKNKKISLFALIQFFLMTYFYFQFFCFT